MYIPASAAVEVFQCRPSLNILSPTGCVSSILIDVDLRIVFLQWWQRLNRFLFISWFIFITRFEMYRWRTVVDWPADAGPQKTVALNWLILVSMECYSKNMKNTTKDTVVRKSLISMVVQLRVHDETGSHVTPIYPQRRAPIHCRLFRPETGMSNSLERWWKTGSHVLNWKPFSNESHTHKTARLLIKIWKEKMKPTIGFPILLW